MRVPSGMVMSVTNNPCGQVGVAVGSGVLVLVGVGVRVASPPMGVNVAVGGTALMSASTVCAAAVALASSGLFDGRLHALRNKAITMNG